MLYTTDFVGREIREGDYLVYTVVRGSRTPSPILARVVRLTPKDPVLVDHDFVPNDSVRLTLVRYQVDNARLDRNSYYFDNRDRTVTLQSASRVVAIDSPLWVKNYEAAHGKPGPAA